MQVSATKVKMAGQRPSTQKGRSDRRLNDESSFLTQKLLNFLAGQRPSTQEGWGDRLLDDARTLAREGETLISPSDLEIVRERITL